MLVPREACYIPRVSKCGVRSRSIYKSFAGLYIAFRQSKSGTFRWDSYQTSTSSSCSTGKSSGYPNTRHKGQYDISTSATGSL